MITRIPLRKIVHIDMDCFFAAIEMRDNPAYRGKPLAVGGNPEGRGVVATCSYEARQFGVRSAMPMAQAVKKCPHLIIVHGRMDAYKKASLKMRSILERYTDTIEIVSIDEAFLDVSQSQHHNGIAKDIAQAIRTEIEQEIGITASAGIAPNKFLAKVASDWRKPNGQFLIAPDQVSRFIKQLPVKRIPGVGPVTAKKMEGLGLHTCGQVQELNQSTLNQLFGSFGEKLHHFVRGEDNRPVGNSSVRQSISIEDTFARDLPTLESCLAEMNILLPRLMERTEKAKHKVGQPKALFVKVRFNDFMTTTKQISSSEILPQIFPELLKEAWGRGQRPVRLLGLGVQYADKSEAHQLQLTLMKKEK